MAEVFGSYASVRGDSHDGWQVIHLATGFRVVCCATRKDCVAVARQFAALPEFTEVDAIPYEVIVLAARHHNHDAIGVAHELGIRYKEEERSKP